MGMITITIGGSFGRKSQSFSAQEHGHAQCVNEAIQWLAKDLLGPAIAQDHKLHEDKCCPSAGFGNVPASFTNEEHS